MNAADLLRAYDELAAPAAAWLLTYLLHSTLLLAGAFLLARLVGSRRLRERLFKGAALGGVLTATFAAFWPAPEAASTFGPLSEGGGWTTRVVPAFDMTLGSGGDSLPAAADATTFGLLSAHQPSLLERALGALRDAFTPVHRWIFGAWSLFAAVLLWRLGRDLLRLRRFLATRWTVASGPMRSALDRLQHTCIRRGGARRVKLSASPGLSSAIALPSGEICVPARALEELSPREQELMVAHELAHLTRRDPLWLRALEVLRRVLFLQPLNGLAVRRVEREAEFLCDEQAVLWTGGGLELARCLEKVAGWVAQSGAGRTGPGRLAVAMVQQGSTLVARVEQVLTPRRRAVSGWQALAVATFLIGGSALLACQGPKVSEAEGDGLDRAEAEWRGQVTAVLRDRIDPEGVLEPLIYWDDERRVVISWPGEVRVEAEQPDLATNLLLTDPELGDLRLLIEYDEDGGVLNIQVLDDELPRGVRADDDGKLGLRFLGGRTLRGFEFSGATELSDAEGRVLPGLRYVRPGAARATTPLTQVDLIIDVEQAGERVEPGTTSAWDGDGPFEFRGRRASYVFLGPSRQGEGGQWARDSASITVDPSVSPDAEQREQWALRLRRLAGEDGASRARIDTRAGTVYRDVIFAVDLLLEAGFEDIVFVGGVDPAEAGASGWDGTLEVGGGAGGASPGTAH